MENKLILVVDDEPDICGELSIFLSRKGFQVLTATNGKDALEMFKKNMPALVITDYKMPEMNGVELLKTLKKEIKEIPVILISGHADLKIAVNALKEEAFDFLNKPIDLKELLTAVNGAIERSKRENRILDTRKTGAIGHEILNIEKKISGIYINIPLDDWNKKLIKDEIKWLIIEKAIERNVIIILQNVSYINNVGLNVLIELVEEFKNNNYRLLFSHLSVPVVEFLKTLGYLDYFKIEQDLSDAITKLSSP